MPKSYDARLEALELKVANAASAQKLSDIQLYKLCTEIDTIEYVTSLGACNTPLMDGYRDHWGETAWVAFLKSLKNKGKKGVGEWWKSLSVEVQNYLISGKEKGKQAFVRD